MSEINLENYMMNFTLTCNNEEINFHAEIPSDQCIFLWIGQDSTAAMSYGLLKHRSVIYGNPAPHSAFQINEFANRLAKIFTERQVFVSTDLDQDMDPKFWANVFMVLKEYIFAHREFFRLPPSDNSETSPSTPASTSSSHSAADSQH
uniref:Gelsolin n=1 Tax=Panagrolaimus sp. PS1159 TaxID=55785 RepID=A0AC35GP27_9BILA